MSQGILSLSLWLAALPLLALTIGHCVSRWYARVSIVANLPVPPGASFLWGHEQAIFSSEPGRAMRQWLALLGPTFRVRAALRAPDILVLTDPVAVAYILQKKIYDYHHSKVVRPRIDRLLGRGLGWVEGEAEHKRMRQLVAPSLTAENIKAMAPDIKEAASRVLDEFADDILARNGTESSANHINILYFTSRATLNVIGRVAFLHDFEGGKSTEAEQILGARRTGARTVTRYASFVALMLLRRFPVLNNLPIPVIQAHGLAKVAIQSGVAKDMVRRNKDYATAESGKQNDLLSRLLLAVNQNKLSHTELYDQISTFIMAGHDGTTNTIGFSVWELARHQDVQDRLRAELIALGTEPSYEDYLYRLPFLDAVLKETLRLYPALPYMERVATKSDIIPLAEPVTTLDGKALQEVEISPGQIILIPIIAIHRLDSVWIDADVFRPDRWLNEIPPHGKLHSGWSNLLAFSEGPRNCIGAKFAIFQYKVILSGMIMRFQFSDAKGDLLLKISSSLQPWISGMMDDGPQLPVKVQIV